MLIDTYLVHKIASSMMFLDSNLAYRLLTLLLPHKHFQKCQGSSIKGVCENFGFWIPLSSCLLSIRKIAMSKNLEGIWTFFMNSPLIEKPFVLISWYSERNTPTLEKWHQWMDFSIKSVVLTTCFCACLFFRDFQFFYYLKMFNCS